VAQEIKKYHKLDCDTFKYPLEDILINAEKVLESKLQGAPDLIRLNLFSKACHKILKVLGQANSTQIFSQNDLLSSSIFVDLEQSKVSIVDWEYSALAYWSNDLAILCRFLTPDQKNILITQYHVPGEHSSIAPEEQRFQIQLNQFIHDFLDIAWKITLNNRLEFQKELGRMEKELESFKESLTLSSKEMGEINSNAFFSHREESPCTQNAICSNSNYIKF
jgi:hypothetical protein